MPLKRRGTPEEQQALAVYINLQRASEAVLARTTAHLARHHLSASQFAILEALYHLGPLSQRDLAQKLLRSAGNISIVLKNMEKRGLIARERAPEDHRYMQVRITPLGQELLLSVWGTHVRGIVEEMSVLTAAEQEELGRLCRKLGLRDPTA